MKRQKIRRETNNEKQQFKKHQKIVVLSTDTKNNQKTEIEARDQCKRMEVTS